MQDSFPSKNISSENLGNEEIISLLKNLERRISKIEKYLDLETESKTEIVTKANAVNIEVQNKEEELEYKIGQFWLAKAGIIVLIIGIAFFLTFPYKNLPLFFPPIMGLMISAVIYGFSIYCRKNYSYICGYLLGGSLTLLYFTTLRLHFFSVSEVLNEISVELILLLIVVILSLLISIRKQSIYLSALSITFGYITAIVSDNSYFLFITVLLMSSLIVFLKLKYNWEYLIHFGIILTYFTHLIWFLNNPLVGKTIQTITSPQFNLIFVLLYALVFALGNIIGGEKEKTPYIISSIMNAIGAYSLLLIITLSMAGESKMIYNLLACVLFLTLAIIYWTKHESKYSTFIYAMLGYLALSVAIIFQFNSPNFFIYLCWQSLLVVSTAVWFRSKFIVLANFIIYVIIFIAYLAMEGKISLVSISYGIVALLSARVLNWKKDRLSLKTEQMRNAYLLTALFIIPYSIYHSIPEGWVSISWISAAILYYMMSLILRNKKYRWMALLTLLLTLGYVFIIAITSSDPTYKIVSFIVLGAVMIIISLLYTKFKNSFKKILKS
jgi:hypothetical protein